MITFKQFLAETIELKDKSVKANAFIKAMYEKYPRNPINGSQFVMVWGEGDDQTFAMIELDTSLSKPDAVEVKWFQAYPLRKGTGSKAMTDLKAEAKKFNVILTLYPWDKGIVSQSKLIKFYKAMGFTPTSKGSKNMFWEPPAE